jgi:hypothetical protein
MEGWGVPAYFGTKVDVGERTVGCYLDVVVTVGAEGHDEEGGIVIEGVIPGDGEEEDFLNVLFLGTPDLLTMFIDDGVLMWVVSDGGGTGQSNKKVREELGFQGNREQEVGKDGSG